MLDGCYACLTFFFFFQAEDGIRDLTVTGVQTCALPISRDQCEDGRVSPRPGDGKVEYSRHRWAGALCHPRRAHPPLTGASPGYGVRVSPVSPVAPVHHP